MVNFIRLPKKNVLVTSKNVWRNGLREYERKMRSIKFKITMEKRFVAILVARKAFVMPFGQFGLFLSTA